MSRFEVKLTGVITVDAESDVAALTQAYSLFADNADIHLTSATAGDPLPEPMTKTYSVAGLVDGSLTVADVEVTLDENATADQWNAAAYETARAAVTDVVAVHEKT